MNWRPVLAVPAVCAVALLALTACKQDSTASPEKTATTKAAETKAAETKAAQTKAAETKAAKTRTPKPKATTPVGDPGDPEAPACATANLKITIDEADGATGHTMAPVHFRNTGPRCWIEGYPTVRTAAGTTAGKTLRGFAGGQAKGDDELSPYLLEKGDTASAVIEALNANPDGTACKAVTELTITPPKQSESVTVTWDGGCARFEVHPIMRGTSGQES
jgi:hypothetical protein